MGPAQMFLVETALDHRVVGVLGQSFALPLRGGVRAHVLITFFIQGTLWISFQLILITL